MAEKKTKTGSKTANEKKSSQKREVKPKAEAPAALEKTRKSYAEKQQVYAICYIAAGILLCCFAFIPGIKAWAYIRGGLFALFGVGFFLLTFLMFALGILASTNKFKRSPSFIVYLSLSVTVFFSSLVDILTHEVDEGKWFQLIKESASIGFNVSADGLHLTGGIFGSAFGELLLQSFGKTAAVATVIILITVNIMLITGLTLNTIGKSIREVSLHLIDRHKEKKVIRKEERAENKRLREEERQNAEEEKKRQDEIVAKLLEEKQEKERLENEEKEKNRIRNEEAQKVLGTAAKTESKSQIDESVERIFGRVSKTEFEKDDDPIASSSHPDFKFTNPFIKPKKEEEPEVPNPYTHPQRSKQAVPQEDKATIDEIIPEAHSLPQQLSFDDAHADSLVKKANAEANENAEKNKASLKGYKEETPRVSTYQLPPISCLNDPKFGNAEDFTQEMRATSQRLLDTLRSFNVDTTLVGVSRGPSVTRYELQPAPGVKISKITNLSDDIALSLATSGVRIEAPIPNKAAVGIEVPNKTKQTVTLKEIVTSESYQTARKKSKLAVALGKDISGSVNCTDIAKMPHLLIAGTTGSGKSVCLNCMIASILFNATPDEVKLLMIDPKQVEFSVYNGIPHLLVPVISNVRKASGALAWAVGEMENRYKAFSECAVRDIFSYNSYCDSHPELDRMPQIVIFIDELTDLMMISPKEVEESICRIAQKARAAGMYLVVATQRPSVDVITGIIKANIPSRLSLSVSSQVDSRTILDSIGAEKLLGLGDMLFKPVGASNPKRIQGAFLSDDEIERIVKFCKEQGEEIYDERISEEIEKLATQENKKSSVTQEEDSDGERDAMFEEAIEVVVESGIASTTLLQRKLRLGYARAARIMDQLQEGGIVGPSEGSKPRKVLISREQMLELKAMADNETE